MGGVGVGDGCVWQDRSAHAVGQGVHMARWKWTLLARPGRGGEQRKEDCRRVMHEMCEMRNNGASLGTHVSGPRWASWRLSGLHSLP